ncbi:MAG: hypothetical protein AYK19_12190 [Theionarchaea archaeon DG-70-1]|nr:MAG: hypothetical protein AYK19_12190 [Theionarchaea archaeon DG-70-1]
MNKDTLNTDSLEILLKEAIRSREEILHSIEESSNKIFALSNISLVLIGAYITSVFFIGLDKKIIILPFLLAVSLSMGGLTIGLLAMFPQYLNIIIVPNELYGLKIEQKHDILDKLLQTYLIQENNLLLKAGEKPFFLKTIATFMIGSIITFLIVIVAIILDIESCRAAYILVTFSLVILVAVLYMVATNMAKYKKRKDNLKKQLEG